MERLAIEEELYSSVIYIKLRLDEKSSMSRHIFSANDTEPLRRVSEFNNCVLR